MSAGLAWAGPAKDPGEPPETVVAVADVHGDFDDFVAILQRTGLIDNQNRWTGGKTTFVQVGDLLDRGPKPREVMDLMMALEKGAAQAGGRVVGLLGNHEMMNIMGDLRYVNPVNYARFADGNSEKRQKAAYDEYVKWRGGHASLLAELPQPMELTEAEWMARHPAGFMEQREAFGPKGEYGEWLRGHAAVDEIEGIIFLHGGIQVSKVLEGYTATHLVLGHTVQKGGRTRPRFGNKVFLIDTGMLSSYYPGGRASALAICGHAKFVAVYLDQQVVLLDSAGSSPQTGGPGEHPGLGMWRRFRKASQLTRRPDMLRSDGRTAIRQRGYERRFYG
jgi:hypothetical protein